MSDLTRDGEKPNPAKIALRSRLLTLRRDLTLPARASAAAHLQDQILDLVRRVAPSTIAAYVPIGPEPGGADLPDLLARQARVLLPVLLPDNDLDWAVHDGVLNRGPQSGPDVGLPTATQPEPGPWSGLSSGSGPAPLSEQAPNSGPGLRSGSAPHPGPVPRSPGRAFGLTEPAGPRLGPDAIRTAELVLVPALAVGRDGTRMGRGGGSYDRALTRLRSPGPLVVALLHDWELIDQVPAEPHDHPVHGVITATGGFTLRRPPEWTK
ncbi:5-formyltetrahydrofolate cyclo-ligase [Micromonosporaceae bacterium Da 78-11]